MTAAGAQISLPASLERESPVIRIAQGTLLFLLGVLYADGFPYLMRIFPPLLHAAYLAIIGCVLASLLIDWTLTRNTRSVAPYLIWLFCYFLWGVIAGSFQSGIARNAATEFTKNIILIGAIALVLNRKTLKPFSILVQLAIIGNVALCLWEAANPELVRRVAYFRQEGATAFNVLRPGGLWSNPDEAAFAFVFGLLMARWAGGIVGWFGRIAALIGIYLGASRTGLALLAVCALFHCYYWFRQHLIIDSTRLAGAFAALLLGGTVAVVAARHFELNPSNHWQLARLIDFAEEHNRDPGDASRTEIANSALQTILESPWYGSGLFAFQLHSDPGVPCVVNPPAHNIYIVIWGEAGPIIGITYLLLMGYGVILIFRTPMPSGDGMAVLLMWICYLITGLTWHNHFTNFCGILYAGLLWRLPAALRVARAPQEAPRAMVFA